MPASAASRIASAAPGAGTNTTEAFAPVSFTASRTVSNTGMPQRFAAAAARSHSADDLRAELERQARVQLAGLAHALDQELRVRVDQDAHARTAATIFSAASFMPSAGVMPSPELASIWRPFSAFVPSSRTTSGTVDADRLRRLR